MKKFIPFQDMKKSIEKQAQRLENKARKLYALRLIDPRAPQYDLAAKLKNQAKALRAKR